MSVSRILAGAGLLAAAVVASAPATRRRLVADVLDLPPATHRHRVERGVRIPTDTPGVTLATDVYHPVDASPGPAVLIRTPYGRRGPTGILWMFASRRFAERGYRVVLQDVRGRFDSGGRPFVPYVHERDDAAATARWIVDQPWSDGRIATWGPSYLGYVQWALAAADGPHPEAMVVCIAAANLGGPADDGAVRLETIVRWMVVVDAMENRELPLWQRVGRLVVPGVQRRTFAPAFEVLPLATADEQVLGRRSDIWRLWAQHPDADDPVWRDADHTDAVATTEAPVHHVSGWYDLFLDRQLADYHRQVEAGRQPYLTIGPWHHLDPRMQVESVREAIAWFDTHLRGGQGRLRAEPVRIWVTGAEEWRELAAWPPPTRDESFAVEAGGRLRPIAGALPLGDDGGTVQDPGALGTAAGGDAAVTRYRYDPADPTPSLGGPLLSVEAGRVDNAPLEARDDVVTFTSAPLTAPIEVMGVPWVRLCVSASTPHVDVVVRLCEVDTEDRSVNVVDGFVRLRPEDWPEGSERPMPVEVRTFPTAHRFAAGMRIRVQVSSGAHPRVARNLGTDAPVIHGTDMTAVDVALHHGDDVQVTLPVTTQGGRPAPS